MAADPQLLATGTLLDAPIFRDSLDEALVGFADSNRDLFREYVAGWYSRQNAEAILEAWGDES